MSTETWKAVLLASLQARDAREKSHDDFISAYTRLAARATIPTPDSPATNDDSELSKIKDDLAAAQQSKALLQVRIKELSDEALGLRGKVSALEGVMTEKKRFERRCVDLEGEIKAKSRHIQELQDEMLTLTMELNVLSDREKATRAENAELVDRWMAEMAKKADAMNKASKWE